MNSRFSRLMVAICIGAAVSFASPAGASAPAGRYTIDATNGVVFDHETGLMWQRAMSSTSYTWANAIAYCEGLTQAGYSDWRLPSRKELHTILDVRVQPMIDANAFPDSITALNCDFWTSSPDAGNAFNAWSVEFLSGWGWSYGVTTRDYVRCVR